MNTRFFYLEKQIIAFFMGSSASLIATTATPRRRGYEVCHAWGDEKDDLYAHRGLKSPASMFFCINRVVSALLIVHFTLH